MMLRYQFTQKSRNAKTGPIPVTMTSSDSCPESCSFRGNGCYAESGPMAWTWSKLSGAVAGTSFTSGKATMAALDLAGLVANIRAIPAGSLWRHNQAGDLPGLGLTIDSAALAEIVAANAGKRGFTYTHKPPVGPNLAAIRQANADGFTVNVSADSAEKAAAFRAANPDVPVVCVLPIEAAQERVLTVGGAKVIVCPATRKTSDGADANPSLTCANCGLCQVANRRAIVGFPAHGARAKVAGAIAGA